MGFGLQGHGGGLLWAAWLVAGGDALQVLLEEGQLHRVGAARPVQVAPGADAQLGGAAGGL